MPEFEHVEKSPRDQVLDWMAHWLRRGKGKLPKDLWAGITWALQSSFWSEEGCDHFPNVAAVSQELPVNHPLLQGTMGWAKCWQLPRDAIPPIGTPEALLDSQGPAGCRGPAGQCVQD
jgi:hypothetical protein